MKQLQPFDFYLLRIPLLPYSRVMQLHATGNKDMKCMINEIKLIFNSNLLQEAIYLASPELHAEMMKWLAGEIPDGSLKEQKLSVSLYKYLLRMSTRCTPYGLFAGCAVGDITDNPTQIEFSSGSCWEKVSRLDMNYLAALSGELINENEIRSEMKFFTNNSLYTIGQTYRYFEYELKDNRRHYYLSTFPQTTYVQLVIEAARAGAYKNDLIKILATKDISEEEAAGFIDTLIHNQVLISTLHPVITGADSLSLIITELQQKGIPGDIPQALQCIQELLAEQAVGVERYIAIKDIMNAYFPQLKGKDLIQADQFLRPQANTLHKKTLDIITNRLHRLLALNYTPATNDLQSFKLRFNQKYEGREIPLMVALDSETGIGYGIISGESSSFTPLIDDLVLPGKTKYPQTVWSPYKKLVLEKFLATKATGAYSINITDEDLDSLTTAQQDITLPATLFLLGTMVAPSPKEMDAGNFQLILKSFRGPGAMQLLGRFAASNTALAEKLADCAIYEESRQPDKILAEIVHLPEGRIGNVLLRPATYSYEIPFLGNAGVPEAFRIPVSDLYVSVRNGAIVLRSKRLNKEIIPRLTSAHDFTEGLPVYKFLCDLQNQHHPFAMRWDWDILEQQTFLPRVTYGQIILQRARWYLTATSFAALCESATADDCLQTLQKNRALPDKVILVEGDNELLIDLTNTFARQILADKLKKDNVILCEYLFDDSTKLISNGNDIYVNEVIIPYRNITFQDKTTPLRNSVPEKAVKRSFYPGSEWMYIKIYTGTKWADKLLKNELLNLVTSLQQDNIIRQWFFIRYQDPENHLRIRFYNNSDPDFTQTVTRKLNELFAYHLENDIIQKIQYDTYIREIERYGEQLIGLTEEFFYHDSNAVVQLLALIRNGDEDYYRWLFAIAGVNHLLNDFGFTPSSKLQLLTQLQGMFFQEFNGNNSLNIQLNNKYRENSKLITAVLQTAPDELLLPPEAIRIFNNRSDAVKKIHSAIIHLVNAGEVDENIYNQLLPDYIHLFLNRLFIANNRLHELVIYHYLMKHYTSAIARKKMNTTI
ncbi:thiopeptide-type bacteriocin biosynthesis protein [Chitinophaga niastensis]|uniref:Thiopeptide-type bacteriocin biosynthesis protein n=1 Tax=Chitinophaga niastensis TaxID=536980 RepID=A0A2P8HT59_CHINA|nr:lantibiotic dehydratase [Chitinophaga niastensis]PSL49403.1 thiopeptide-type bacteriocin biosynthesis protein [Chitinophaga niastensis]